MKVGKVVEEWKIWDKENKAVKLEEEAKRLVSKRFYKWIHIFNKKASEQMSTKKLWNYMIDTKKGFVLRKRKVYLLSREEREEVCKFILEQLRKGYIRPSNSSQTALIFFVEKKGNKKRMV